VTGVVVVDGGGGVAEPDISVTCVHDNLAGTDGGTLRGAHLAQVEGAIVHARAGWQHALVEVAVAGVPLCQVAEHLPFVGDGEGCMSTQLRVLEPGGRRLNWCDGG